MQLTEMEIFVLALGAMIAGILMLVRGGNWTIDAAVHIARHFGLSPLIVGFTIVAFGTSFPELVVSVFANMQGSGGIALGNVIGSNIANILLVIGVTAASAPVLVSIASLKAMRRDLIVMLICSAGLIGLLLNGTISQTMGLVMCAILAGYIFLQYSLAKRGAAPNPLEAEEAEQAFKSQLSAAFFLVIGLFLIAIGAEFMVRGAKVSAHLLGVPEAVVGLSIIAFGTSLPELSTCIIAARKGHGDIALGNIVGSNVFNILMIIGITASVKPIISGTYDPQLASFDVWVMMAASLVFAGLLLVIKRIPKPAGILFIAAYLGYIGYIYAQYLIRA